MTGAISLTCDAWQASNANAYFTDTGHWIEEAEPGEWVKQSALFGFTQMNCAHSGELLGQALYKICNRLDIIHKVSLCQLITPCLALSHHLVFRSDILPATMLLTIT